MVVLPRGLRVGALPASRQGVVVRRRRQPLVVSRTEVLVAIVPWILLSRRGWVSLVVACPLHFYYLNLRGSVGHGSVAWIIHGWRHHLHIWRWTGHHHRSLIISFWRLHSAALRMVSDTSNRLGWTHHALHPMPWSSTWAACTHRRILLLTGHPTRIRLRGLLYG